MSINLDKAIQSLMQLISLAGVKFTGDDESLLLDALTRYHNDHSIVKSRKKADENVDNGGHIADSGIGTAVARLPDRPGVHHVVQLLKEVSYHEGQGKKPKVFRNAALGHIPIVALAAEKTAYSCAHTLTSLR